MSRLRMRCRRDDAGFTFVEVLTVMIILAILALIAIATFFNQRQKAERSRAISALRNAETFAVAIQSDGELSSCIGDYREVAGQNAPYVWVQDSSGFDDTGSGATTDANMISVYGGPDEPSCATDPTTEWVSLASFGSDTCFYQLLVSGGSQRLRHRAPPQEEADPPLCEASEIAPSTEAGKVRFRGESVAPSGW